MPIGYESGSRWNQWKTKWISGIFIGTLALDSQYWPYQNDASEQQVGDLSDYVGGEIRTLRMGMVGTLNFESPWVYTLFAATHAFDKGFDTDDDNTLSLLDWRLDIPLWKQTSLALGKQKELISMERISSLAYLPWQERSAPADAFLPARNVGVALSGTVFDQRATWAGGVYNDWFDTGKTFDESTNHYVGRLTWLPYIKKKEDALLHLGLACATRMPGKRLDSERHLSSTIRLFLWIRASWMPTVLWHTQQKPPGAWVPSGWAASISAAG